MLKETKQYTNIANIKDKPVGINIDMDMTHTCTDCNETFKTLFSYEAHQTKFHKDILKVSVAKSKPVYQKDLWSGEQTNGGLKDLKSSESFTNLINQNRLTGLILKQGMKIMSKN